MAGTSVDQEDIVANVAIMGAGLMGTATAYPLADNGHAVRLVGTHLDGDIIKSCHERRYHPRLGESFLLGYSPTTWRRSPRHWMA
jgi:flavin-dependent dehydrogenase